MGNKMTELNKYIVCFECSFSIGYEHKSRVRFYQFWTRTPEEALEAAEPTRQMISKQTGRDYVIEGVYEKCSSL